MNRSELNGKVQTVLGLISPDDLGVTLPHEHCLVDVLVWFVEPETSSEKFMAYQPVSLDNLGWVRYHPTSNLDNIILQDEEVAIKETLRYKYAGGNSLVDLTPIGLGRDPLALARISRATGLNIVMGTGYYVRKAVPKEVELTEGFLADVMIRDILEGVVNTGSGATVGRGMLTSSKTWCR